MYKNLKAFILLLSLLSGSFVYGQSIWVDRNPYSRQASIGEGSILKLRIDEPVIVEYEYQNTGDEQLNVSMKPDRELTGFLPNYSTEKSISKEHTKTIRSRGNIKLNMAVTVLGVDDNGVVRFQGVKSLAQEREDSRIDVRVSGRVQAEDIQGDRRIESVNVADLNLSIAGLPIAQDRGLPMKSEETPDGQVVPSASLSDAEKEQLLLEYINRMLGESRDLP